MAHAKPVVAFHAGAVPEVVAHSDTGILVERDNITELANALVRLASDAKMRQAMGMRGYERVRSRFTAERMVEETVACYRQVIAESGKGQVLPRGVIGPYSPDFRTELTTNKLQCLLLSLAVPPKGNPGASPDISQEHLMEALSTFGGSYLGLNNIVLARVFGAAMLVSITTGCG